MTSVSLLAVTSVLPSGENTRSQSRSQSAGDPAAMLGGSGRIPEVDELLDFLVA